MFQLKKKISWRSASHKFNYHKTKYQLNFDTMDNLGLSVIFKLASLPGKWRIFVSIILLKIEHKDFGFQGTLRVGGRECYKI